MILRRLVPLAIIAALVAGAPGAYAAENVSRDPAGDLVDQETDDPAPEVKIGDITKVTTKHGARVLTLTTTFVERTDGSVAWRVVTPKRNFFIDMVMFGFPERYVTPTLQDRGGKRIKCRNLRRVELPKRSRSIKVRVPRKCLGNPRWVRTGSIASAVIDGIQYADDAHRDTSISQFKISVGPRVKPD